MLKHAKKAQFQHYIIINTIMHNLTTEVDSEQQIIYNAETHQKSTVSASNNYEVRYDREN